MKKERIDNLLQTRGFAETLLRAKALVMSGVVLANERRVEKPSETFAPDVAIRLKGDTPEARYVSRGGLKLEKALAYFAIDATDYRCLDIGSSTGGFTDCLLQHGAVRVTAIDAGTNQLAWRLRIDPRVVSMENTNARLLLPEQFETKFDLIVMDVSFISVKKIIGALVPLLALNGRMVVLIKPQFEVRRSEVGDGGIVRDAEKHMRVVNEISAFAKEAGLKVAGQVDSPIAGAEGNKEFFVLYEKS